MTRSPVWVPYDRAIQAIVRDRRIPADEAEELDRQLTGLERDLR